MITTTNAGGTYPPVFFVWYLALINSKETVMFSHITVGTRDLQLSGAFYDSVLGTIGHERGIERDTFIAYGHKGSTRFFVMHPFDGDNAASGNGWHAAFEAKTCAEVDAFHAKALLAGGTDEGPPGLRPQYHAQYYAAYVRDLDGNKIQAVCHKVNS
jgi:catechol 2,3-dioxygenase-like lactoylglutathione lyase family enzyme